MCLDSVDVGSIQKYFSKFSSIFCAHSIQLNLLSRFASKITLSYGYLACLLANINHSKTHLLKPISSTALPLI